MKYHHFFIKRNLIVETELKVLPTTAICFCRYMYLVYAFGAISKLKENAVDCDYAPNCPILK